MRAGARVRLVQTAGSRKYEFENRIYRSADFKSAKPRHRETGHFRTNANPVAVNSDNNKPIESAGHAQVEPGKTVS